MTYAEFLAHLDMRIAYLLKTLVLLLALIMCMQKTVNCQNLILYKTIDTIKLYLEVHHAETNHAKNPAIIFFFGGGWIGGNRSHFIHHAQYFKKRGITCFLADYRIANIHGTTPFESLRDAKSAIRYLRAHANQLNIDPQKVIAAGGSAGGHLAAATAMIDGFDDDQDDMSVDCVPNALVLYNPVIDNGPAGYGFERIGPSYKSFSPLHNIDCLVPPTILFLGTEDPLIPVETAEYYANSINRIGGRCDLHLFQGQRHGFFNYRNFDHYRTTVILTDEFLVDLGYVDQDPVVSIE